MPSKQLDELVSLAARLALGIWLVATAGRQGLGAEVSFRNEVMAVLSKAGCNLGVCHGNQNGKAGFKLSLRGQDPSLDWQSLTHDQFGRRTNRLDPQRSLILEKATVHVAHEGGQRFSTDSLEYGILLEWIAGGLKRDPPETPKLTRIEAAPCESILVDPADSVQLSVKAVFSDGSARDVTRLAVYEPANKLASVDQNGVVRRDGMGETTILVRFLDRQVPVRFAFVPERPEFIIRDSPENNYIDHHVFAKLRMLRINASELCDDVVFLRRAYLDLLGILPTASEARAFRTDRSADKRPRLVDALLERPEFADFWALKWSDLLRNEEKTLDRKGVQSFHQWIRSSIAASQPVDLFVHDLVAARGSTYSSPAANYYRANRDPVSRAEATAQLFLGLRLQCAKCHNHPFDRWTQDDYYSWASLFARVDYKILENNRRDKNDLHEFDGEQVVWMSRSGELENPRTQESAVPRFLGDHAMPLAPDDDRLEALADWIVSEHNPYFARSQINRIWYHLLGRGVVDPIDDFRATNPPSNPALLDTLAADFASHQFDLRHMLRTIMASRTYQLSAETNATNEEDEANFSHGLVRPLSAEQLLDSLNQVTGVSTRFRGYPQGLRASQLPGVISIRARGEAITAGEQFLTQFGKPPRLLTCECERSGDTTLRQAFQLIGGATINEALHEPDNRLGRLLTAGKSDAELVDELFWTALSRPPGEPELAGAKQYMAEAKDRRAALEDLVWGLLNAKEFLLRQ